MWKDEINFVFEYTEGNKGYIPDIHSLRAPLILRISLGTVASAVLHVGHEYVRSHLGS
jgi:hypothetical protein